VATETEAIKALAHPLRREILRELERRADSASGLARRLDVPLSNLTYHLRILRRAELVREVRAEPRRGVVERFYEPAGRSYVESGRWAQLPEGLRRSASRAWLESVGREVAESEAAGGFEAGDAQMLRARVQLDAAGRAELGRAMEDLYARALELERKADDPATVVVLMLFDGAPE